jgi:hypothetical protein
MGTQIFVNLPVKDLKRSVQFFTRLGYRFDPQFTDENATCMIVGGAALLESDALDRLFVGQGFVDGSRGASRPRVRWRVAGRLHPMIDFVLWRDGREERPGCADDRRCGDQWRKRGTRVCAR